MKRTAITLGVLACLLLTYVAIQAQEEEQEPAEIDKTEEVEVDLMLIDVVVIDNRDQTVAGLTQDDFELTIADQPASIDTFDVICPEGALGEPPEVKEAADKRPLGPDVPRRIVLAVDYYNLRMVNRPPVLNQAQWMVRNGKTPSEEIMIVSLADGLRIEQPFSTSMGQALGTLNRMEHDVSLWGRQFGTGVSGRTYFENLATLMDVLAQYDGSKAVVFFSELIRPPSGDWDLWYTDVATRAANAQASFYPVEAFGLSVGSPTGGSPALSRLANESGGRLTRGTNDLSMAYARAQRDQSCRYSLGHYLERGEGRKRNRVRVYVRDEAKKNVSRVLYPELVRLWSEEELMASRLRAAHADPGPFDNPLIRSFVFPLSPRSPDAWDVLAAIHFDLPMGSEPIVIDASATLLKGTKIERQFKATRHTIDPPKDPEADSRSVTLMGESKVDPGDHRLNVVLSRPGGDRPYTSQAIFNLPEVPQGELFLQGPHLARAVPGGVLIRGDNPRSKKSDEPTPLEQIIGPDATFEPLFVYQIAPDDLLLAAWSACIVNGDPPANATIRRLVLTEDGSTVVHELDALELDVPPRGRVRCHEKLDSLPAGTLQPGDYLIKIVAQDGSGNELVSESVPLLVQ